MRGETPPAAHRRSRRSAAHSSRTNTRPEKLGGASDKSATDFRGHSVGGRVSAHLEVERSEVDVGSERVRVEGLHIDDVATLAETGKLADQPRGSDGA